MLRRTIVILTIALAMMVVAVTARPSRYGHGGHGLHAASALSYQGVMSCVFKLVDVNHDAQLHPVELRLALRRWLKTSEQVLDGLTEHRLLAQCDTDESGSISWDEAIEEPRCLTLSQVEGLAKWMCARAEHKDFVFDEYRQTALAMEQGIMSGKGLKSVQQEFQVFMNSQNDARRAAYARRLHTTRISDEVDALISDLGSALSNVVVIPIAIFIVILSLVLACVL